MHIYIDEAGLFIPTNNNRISLVAALTIPTTTQQELFYEFLRLRDHWPNNPIEPKGRTLNETQTNDVITLLTAHDAIVEFLGINMTTHPHPIIDDLKKRQAAAVTKHLTSKHHPTIIKELHRLSNTIQRMPNQLFIQAFLTINLIIETIQTTTLYFAQRQPTELATITWTIDQKDHTITNMEKTWTELILPATEARFATQPLKELDTADYTHLARYETDPADERMTQHVQWLHNARNITPPPAGTRLIDAKKLLTAQQHFADSRDDLGLQLADITASTLARACNNHLQQHGWENLGRLLIKKNNRIPIIALGTRREHPNDRLEGHHAHVWRTLHKKAKTMLTEKK